MVARAFVEPPGSPQEVAERYGALFQDVIGRCEGQSLPDGLPDADAEAIRKVLYEPDSPCEVPDELIVDVEGYFPTSAINELLEVAGRGGSMADSFEGGAALCADLD